MKLGFTEFSYGYAFTENLIRSSISAPVAAPVFPNLVQEAKCGYDVKVELPGMPLFFQFKLPELMERNNAKEIKLGLCGLSVQFFRMPLMRKDISEQHAKLIDLEKKFPKAVFYASPGNKDFASFNSAYSQAEVHLQSVLFSPSDIGELPDNKSHYVSYCPVKWVAWRCSEPKRVKAYTFKDIEYATNEALSERRGRSLQDTINEVHQRVRCFIPSELRNAEQELRQRVKARMDSVELIDDRARSVSMDILVLRELVRVGVGGELLIAQPRDSKA